MVQSRTSSMCLLDESFCECGRPKNQPQRIPLPSRRNDRCDSRVDTWKPLRHRGASLKSTMLQ